jgi:Family of unknown function (DUF6152)
MKITDFVEKARKPLWWAVVLAAVAPAAWSHHSFAMFDTTKTVTLAGTVKEFQWSNPHCWIQLLVDEPEGQQEWGIEMTSPSGLLREGWHPHSLQAGDKISVSMHPLSSGAQGGSEIAVTTADGTQIGHGR